MRKWPCWARVRLAGSLWWWTAGTRGHCSVWYYRTPWGALWGAWRLHREEEAACALCHGTGVIMSPGCDCGSGPESPCEAFCATVQCPNDCPLAESREEARRVWRAYWPAQPGDDKAMIILLGQSTTGVPAADDAFMQAVYRQLDAMSLPGDGHFDVEAAMDRFRAGMRKMDEDPAERARIERLAEGTDRLMRDLGDDAG